MNSRKLIGAILAGFLCLSFTLNKSETAEYSKETLSPVYTVDKIYRSMKGPQSTLKFKLGETEKPELLWITGYRAVMVGENGQTVMPQEFMCHSNLDIDIVKHRRLFKWRKNVSQRLFTLSQGQLDIKFPKGFGIPVLSSEEFSLATQVLNLNYKDQVYKVRHRVSIDYVRDNELTHPMKPLFLTSATGLVLLEGDDGYYNVPKSDKQKHGPGCMIGNQAGRRTLRDRFGRKFTGHWVVKPGREVNQTLVTRWMNLPYDTTAHYIAVHIHPFAESLVLRDLTTGDIVFESKVEEFEDKIGIDRVDFYSSAEGIPLYKDHEYELTSVYNNTTSEDQDSMAVMFMYVIDKDYTKPDLSGFESFRKRSATKPDPPEAVN